MAGDDAFRGQQVEHLDVGGGHGGLGQRAGSEPGTQDIGRYRQVGDGKVDRAGDGDGVVRLAIGPQQRLRDLASGAYAPTGAQVQLVRAAAGAGPKEVGRSSSSSVQGPPQVVIVRDDDWTRR